MSGKPGAYSYRVRATDAAGNLSAYSNLASAITQGAGAQVYYIQTDHLNTPRMIANQTGTAVWRWDNTEPFGATLPNDDPDGDGVPFVFDLRFPGQYFDRETGLSYNVFRDYDSGIGRYVQSDPIGIMGGINSFVYASNVPLVSIDPLGLRDCKFVFVAGQPYESTREGALDYTFIAPVPGKYDNKKLVECLLSSSAPGKPKLPGNVVMVLCQFQIIGDALVNWQYGLYLVTQDIMGQMVRDVRTEEWCRDNSCEPYKFNKLIQTDREKLGDEYFKYTRWLGLQILPRMSW